VRRLLSLIAALLIAGLVLPWAAWPARPQSGPVVVLGPIRTLDPALASRLDEYRLIAALSTPLVRLDPVTLAPQPGLALRWDTAPDGLAWTFHLDARACWRDGRPVTATDMRRGLLRHLLLGSPNAAYLEDVIAGARVAATALPARLAGLEDAGLACPDERTLVVRLRHPAPWLPALLSLAPFVPATQAQLDADLAGRRDGWSDPTTLDGDGPLRCSGHLPRHHYDLVPNPAYRGAHPARGPLRALIVEDGAAAARLYLAGQADALLSLPTDLSADLAAARVPGLQLATSLATEFLRVRLVARTRAEDARTTRALADPRVRLALARAIDRVALARDLLHGLVVPARSFVPADFARFSAYRPPLGALDFAPAQARADLAAAQAALGALPPLALLAPAQPAERAWVAEFIADGWRRELGLAIEVRLLLPTELRTRERAFAFDLSRGYWQADFPDPTNFLECFRAGAGSNRTGYADAAYAALLDRAGAEDGEARLATLVAAERRLLADPPLIPLYHPQCAFVARPGLEGVQANDLETVHLDEVGWSAEPR
jgi:oligopeptide transport system substrate-binding protein